MKNEIEVYKLSGKKTTEYFVIGQNRVKYIWDGLRIKKKTFNHITATKVKQELKRIPTLDFVEFLMNKAQTTTPFI